jgi:SAM-dependent methyltransferase
VGLSFDLRRLLIRVLGRERFRRLVYAGFFWFTSRRGGACMNYGYAPVSAATTGDPSCKEPFQIELYRQVAEALGPEQLRGRRVIEVSCGLGGGFDHLSRHFGFGLGVALDWSSIALRAARRRFGILALRGNALAMPFADGTFETIINVEASHIYHRSGKFYAEIARTLAPGGTIAMADFPEGSADVVEAAMRERLGEAGLEVVGYRTVTDNIVEARVLDARRVETELVGSPPWPIRKLLRKELGDPLTDPTVIALRERRLNYFILTARHLDETPGSSRSLSG